MTNLEIHAGPRARARLLEHGLRGSQFDVIVGASGGPKWLVLSALDQLLFPWLTAERATPLRSVGSSVGAWRHLCLAQADPSAAVRRLHEAYMEQHYSAHPDAAEVSQVAQGIIAHVLGSDGARQITQHSVLQTHIVTARGLGPWRARNRAGLIAASIATALGNGLNRKALRHFLERCCFHTGSRVSALSFPRLPTRYEPLREDNLASAALASGSIPLLARGVEGLRPGEVFWDGGMTDYHFEPDFGPHPGLILYPHFYPFLVPGWFDKLLRWRRSRGESWEGLVLLAPSREFVARLPRGRIPDRSDFRGLAARERQRIWRVVTDEGQRLADEFAALCEGRGLAQALRQ